MILIFLCDIVAPFPFCDLQYSCVVLLGKHISGVRCALCLSDIPVDVDRGGNMIYSLSEFIVLRKSLKLIFISFLNEAI